MRGRINPQIMEVHRMQITDEEHKIYEEICFDLDEVLERYYEKSIPQAIIVIALEQKLKEERQTLESIIKGEDL
jgi:hypothetical protein